METKVPDNANAHCPGTDSNEAGKASSCEGCPNQKICASSDKTPQAPDQKLTDALSKIKHKILVLSGKGGVGKSTTSSQLAFGLASMGYEVGLLDLDLCGPSVPRTMGLEDSEIHVSAQGWSPVYVLDNLAVVSIGFMLPSKDDAVVWRGPKKNGLIKQFLTDVEWGPLDFLIVDTPPGTSDEHISIVQYLGMDEKKDGSVIVTTSQKLSVNDVRKEINFCKKTDVRILGIVENMKELICEHCGKSNPLFAQKNFDFVNSMIEDYKLDYLVGISFARDLLFLSENGKSLFDKENETEPLKHIKGEFEVLIAKICEKVGAQKPVADE